MQHVVAAFDGIIEAAIFQQLAFDQLQSVFSVGIFGNLLQESHLGSSSATVRYGLIARCCTCMLKIQA